MSGFVKSFQRIMLMPTLCQSNRVSITRDSEGKMRILDSARVEPKLLWNKEEPLDWLRRIWFYL